MALPRLGGTCLELEFPVGAGEGNRTLMTSLEGWGSAIELRPRGGGPAPGKAATPVAYRLQALCWFNEGSELRTRGIPCLLAADA